MGITSSTNKLRRSDLEVPFISNSEKLENFAVAGDNKIKQISTKAKTDQEAKEIYSLPNPENGEEPKVWIKKWVDYSKKYGLGYLLSNSCTGVYFNDNTSMVADPIMSYFQYIHRPREAKPEVVNFYTFNNFPCDLQKKVKLLLLFIQYLKDIEDIQEINTSRPLIYVRKWIRTSHGIIFKLSNKIEQVSFPDKSAIVFCSKNKIVTYINDKGERIIYPLSSAMDSGNCKMVQRLRYAKEFLVSMQLALHAGSGEYRTQATKRDL